jgi:hypothetical protein
MALLTSSVHRPRPANCAASRKIRLSPTPVGRRRSATYLYETQVVRRAGLARQQHRIVVHDMVGSAVININTPNETGTHVCNRRRPWSSDSPLSRKKPPVFAVLDNTAVTALLYGPTQRPAAGNLHSNTVLSPSPAAAFTTVPPNVLL